MGKNIEPKFNDEVVQFIEKHPDIVQIVIDLMDRQPTLEPVVNQLMLSYMAIVNCFDKGGKLFLCGNGGSFADCLHISGEMLKSYERKRNLTQNDRLKFQNYPDGEKLAASLEYGLPVIVLGLNHSLKSAVENDIHTPGMGYAQELFALGNENDMLLGISTSGNAQNVAYAMTTAKVLGMRTIGLTGQAGGPLSEMVEIAIKAPASMTNRVQEFHQLIYHTLCSLVEAHYFPEIKTDDSGKN